VKTFQLGEIFDSPYGKYGGGPVVNEQGRQVGFWDLNPEARYHMWLEEEALAEEAEWLRMEQLEAQGEIKMAELNTTIDFELADDPPPEWWELGWTEDADYDCDATGRSD